MPSFGQGRLAYELEADRFYPDDLLHQAQSILAHLARIDQRYENALRGASASGGDVSTALLSEIERRRQGERRRYERQLTAIHERVSDIIMADLTSNR